VPLFHAQTCPPLKRHPPDWATPERIDSAFRGEGVVVIESLFSHDFCARSILELESAIEKEAEFHGTKNYRDYGMVLVCPVYGGAFNEVFDNAAFMMPFNQVLGEGSIVYAYTSSSMPKAGSNYSARIHQDCPRHIPGYRTNVGATVLLQDFTEENGATYFLPCSQDRRTAPTEAEFMAGARRLLAPAGSVCFFDALVWHRGGENHTTAWRHALTLNMARSFMKQRLDIPRMLSPEVAAALSPTAKQKLGFLAQVPASLTEYYAPPHLRKYQQAPE
jgi:hypothetical protein